MTMQEIIAIVGKGKELSRDLTHDEALEAMRLLMEAEATPYQIGAFFVAVRIKGESAEELAAFTQAAKRYGAPFHVDNAEHLVDIPVYSGKKRTFHACLPAALIMAAAGVPVMMHGYSEMPGKVGLVPILQALGIPVNLETEQVNNLLNRIGFGYSEISYLHLLLYRYLELRKELGVRTFINTMLRVYNPAGAKRHLIGVTHRAYLERLAKTLSLLGSRSALIFRGIEGESEAPMQHHGVMTELKEGSIRDFSPDLSSMGFPNTSSGGLLGGDIKEEAAWVVRVLSNKEEGGGLDIVLLNAGLGIYVSGKVSTVGEGAALAREALTTGAAAAKFVEVMQISREV